MRPWNIVGVALAFVCAAGCRTTQEVLRDYEVALSVGQYSKPVNETTELAGKGDDSQLLWQLLSGAAQYMADDKVGARRMFDAAEDTFAKNDMTSVFAQAGQGALAMMTNDRVFSYDGGGQDRIFTCLYKAIDFMSDRNHDAALVELNRVVRYQANWLYDRRRDIDAAARKMESDAAAYERQQGAPGNRSRNVSNVLGNASFQSQIRSKCRFNPVTSGNLSALAPKDYVNVYAEHVTGVFRWLNGNSDLNYLREVATLAPGNAVAVRDYRERSKGVRPVNQVWIYAEDGLCPCREEWRLDLPLGLLPFVRRYVIYAGMALPYLRERAHGAISWSVLADGRNVPMTPLADVDALVKTEYDVYMRGALAREVTRTVVKVGAQVALGVMADAAERRQHKKNRGAKDRSGDYLALKVAQLGVATWAMSTTAADVRSWTALPKTVKVARVDRSKDGRLAVVADGQRIELEIPEGNAMVFIRKPGPSALPVVKMATF